MQFKEMIWQVWFIPIRTGDARKKNLFVCDIFCKHLRTWYRCTDTRWTMPKPWVSVQLRNFISIYISLVKKLFLSTYKSEILIALKNSLFMSLLVTCKYFDYTALICNLSHWSPLKKKTNNALILIYTSMLNNRNMRSCWFVVFPFPPLPLYNFLILNQFRTLDQWC